MPKTYFAGAAVLAYGLVCLKSGFGPVRLLVFCLNHLSATGAWLLQEAAPAVWRVRNRYQDCFKAIDRGWRP